MSVTQKRPMWDILCVLLQRHWKTLCSAFEHCSSMTNCWVWRVTAGLKWQKTQIYSPFIQHTHTRAHTHTHTETHTGPCILSISQCHSKRPVARIQGLRVCFLLDQSKEEKYNFLIKLSLSCHFTASELPCPLLWMHVCFEKCVCL